MDFQYIFTIITVFLAVLGITIQAVNYLYPWLKYDLRFIKIFFGTLQLIRKGSKRTPAYTMVDRLVDVAKKTPDKTFIYFQDEGWSYKRLNQMANQVARAIRKEGIEEKDTVALMMSSRPEFVGMWFGLAKAGMTAAFINHNIRGKSLYHCLEVSKCKAIVISNDEDLIKAVSDIEEDLKSNCITIYTLGEIHRDSTLSHRPLRPLMDDQSTVEIPLDWRKSVEMSSHFCYVYTSGTTGLPKAAVVQHNKAIMSSRLLACADADANDVVYAPLPLYHAAAGMIGVLGSLQLGCSIIIRPKFSASHFWDDCRRYRATIVQYIGETMRYVCDQPPHKDDKNHCVRAAVGNGLRPLVWKKFLERHGKYIKIVEFYASTEGNAGFINLDGDVGSVGTFTPFMKFTGLLDLVKYDQEKDEVYRDANGRCVAVTDGVPGLLVGKITETTQFHGYRGNKKQTEKKILRNVFKDGDSYFNSGDLLRKEKDHHVYFVDRVGDTFRWKGENVSTNEVADVMSSAPGIKEANVYGVEIAGNEGRAGMMVVLLHDGVELDCDGVYQHACDCIASYARPIFLRVKKELELTATFKQKKVALVKEGFEPRNMGGDPIYYMDHKNKCYSPLTEEKADNIIQNKIRV